MIANKIQLPRSVSTLKSQAGVMLLESLVAIIIFSIGLLGLVALQSKAISLDQDARYRADAASLANQLISEMWVANKGQLATNYATGGTGTMYNSWVARVNQALPGAAANPPIVVWGASNQITITIRWKLPSSKDLHRYDVTAQIQEG